MSSPPCASDSASSFDRLHREAQRWIREQGWRELRPVQDLTIKAVLDGQADVIVCASTAAGKTEAAFLPALTRVAGRDTAGFSILYVSPLKALINDQFRRLDELCERLELPVVRWHGDAPQGAKARARRDPAGVALITPESIEAMFLRRPEDAANMLSALDFIIIDELHAFLRGPRGLHLSSLLSRIDSLGATRPRRIGLSATIGAIEDAARWLRPTDPDSVQIVEPPASAPELQLQVRAYINPPEDAGLDELEAEEGAPQALDHIADHMFATLRGANNLVFGGSRRTVEALADRLRRRSEKAGVPNEFFPHHGSLSKELREELETRLKAGTLPTTAVATTTLELGIDIGSVKSVAQIGAPRSLASLRQRLGRSGRREGVPAILRIYLRENFLAPDADPLDRLRLSTIRAVAAVRLLLQGFVEPSTLDPSVATVVLHQTLSLITQHGALPAAALYRSLCEVGPLSALDRADYAALLRQMAEARLIEQAPNGLIMLGEQGERLVAGRDFYALFESDQEWRLVAGGRFLGTLPLSNVLMVGSLVAFAGQRWRVIAVDDPGKTLEVVVHRAGKLPRFDRLAVEDIHDCLAQEMVDVYRDDDQPAYLDRTAKEQLAIGRDAFRDLGLGQRNWLGVENDTYLFTWRGSAINQLLAVLLTSAGLECEAFDVGVCVTDAAPDEIAQLLRHAPSPPDPDDLSGFVGNLQDAKFDALVPDPLLRRLWARRHAAICQQMPTVIGNFIHSQVSADA